MRRATGRPAVAGGIPVRRAFLPYGLHTVGAAEERAVLDVLRNGWLTAGPRVKAFETAFAKAVDARHAVAVATGTAGLHLGMLACGIGRGAEVITSPLTFVATANAVVHAGGRPVFADVDPLTLNIDPGEAERRVTRKTKAIVPVHLAGFPCDMRRLRRVATHAGAYVIEDACHAAGASYRGRPIGSGADAQVFSFHPVKNMTTAEGAVVTTSHASIAESLRTLRFHGFREDYLSRSARGALGYPRMQVLGFKSVLTDLQAALGLVQLRRLARFNSRRGRLAALYSRLFADVPEVEVPHPPPHTTPSWHLYVLRLNLEQLRCTRDEFMHALRKDNIGTSVHYMPVHLQPYYRRAFGFKPGDFPVAEREYRRMVTLPLFPSMRQDDVNDVVTAVTRIVAHYRR